MDRAASDLARRLAGDAEAVCRRYLSNGRRSGRYWVVGNVLNTPGRSLYVRLVGPAKGPGAAGRWTDAASGDHGDLLDLLALQGGLALGEAMREARRFLGDPARTPPARHPTPGPRGAVSTFVAAQRLWAEGAPIAGTLADRYLHSRGLALPSAGSADVPALRFHPRCRYRAEGGGASPCAPPALLAQVTGPDGRFLGVQRTWLDPATGGKARLDPPRKALGRIGGGAVRFGAPGAVLAVGEGIETVLSVQVAFPGLPVAAVLSAGNLAQFEPPAGLGRLYVALDRDPAGEAATDRLLARAEAAGIEAVRLCPEGGDFNDDLRTLGAAALGRRLALRLARADHALRLGSGDG